MALTKWLEFFMGLMGVYRIGKVCIKGFHLRFDSSKNGVAMNSILDLRLNLVLNVLID